MLSPALSGLQIPNLLKSPEAAVALNIMEQDGLLRVCSQMQELCNGSLGMARKMYAQRCKLEANTKGLVRGRHQLGYKVLPDKVENSDAKRMVEHFPAGADMDDFESFLKQQGFLEIKILEKSPRRTGTTWIFRGTRKDRGELIQGRIADDENQKQSLPRQCALGGPKNVPSYSTGT